MATREHGEPLFHGMRVGNNTRRDEGKSLIELDNNKVTWLMERIFSVRIRQDLLQNMSTFLRRSSSLSLIIVFLSHLQEVQFFNKMAHLKGLVRKL